MKNNYVNKMIKHPLVAIILLFAACHTPPEKIDYPPYNFTISSPESQGVSSDSLISMFNYILEEDLNIHSLLIVRNENLITEAYFHPFSKDNKHILQSSTKAVVSALIGIAINEGTISGENQKVYDSFSGLDLNNVDEQKEKLEVQHLLSMTTGMDFSAVHNEPVSENIIKHMLEQPMITEPGTHFTNGSPETHILSALIQKSTGKTTAKYAEEKLFSPLSIIDYYWDSDPEGITYGPSGLHMLPIDMAKFGQLLLNHGNIQGYQVIPEEWVEKSTKSYATTLLEDSISFDWGYGLWTNPFGGFSAIGSGGQFIVVLRESGLVLVITSGLKHSILVMKHIVEKYVLPALISDTAIPENITGTEALKELIQKAQHPKPKAIAKFPEIASGISGKEYDLEKNNLGLPILQLTFHVDRCAFNLGSISMPVGLNGLFITTKTKDFSMSTRGAWKDDSTFHLELQDMSSLSKINWLIKFEENSVNIIQSVDPWGRLSSFSGKAKL